MKSIIFLAMLAIFNISNGQQMIKKITVEITEPSDLDLIISLDMTDNDILPDEKMMFCKVEGANRIIVPFQVENSQLIWMIDGPVAKGLIHYEIKYGESKNTPDIVKAVKQNGRLIIKTDSLNLLCYQFETLYPPSGVDTAYKRSAFIHPLWTPHGQVLTRIQPPDHYHHYGIWNPWSQVLFEGDTIDFWNLKKRLGNVRFARFKTLTDGPVFSEYEALHEHVVFKDNGMEKIALNELQKVKVYRPHNDYFIVDIIINYRCASENPFKILEYRYAGLGWRATGEWNKDNSEVLTSEGKTRKNADGSLAKWFIVQGKLGDDSGGIVMMSYSSNYNHPEPIRVWPESMYERGDVYANFVPTKNKDWLLEPGKTYTLKYRMIVFNGKFTPEKADNGWLFYTSSPKLIKIE